MSTANLLRPRRPRSRLSSRQRAGPVLLTPCMFASAAVPEQVIPFWASITAALLLRLREAPTGGMPSLFTDSPATCTLTMSRSAALLPPTPIRPSARRLLLSRPRSTPSTLRPRAAKRDTSAGTMSISAAVPPCITRFTIRSATALRSRLPEEPETGTLSRLTGSPAMSTAPMSSMTRAETFPTRPSLNRIPLPRPRLPLRPRPFPATSPATTSGSAAARPRVMISSANTATARLFPSRELPANGRRSSSTACPAMYMASTLPKEASP